VGAAGEIIYFTAHPNAQNNRQDLARGATFAWNSALKGVESCGDWLVQTFREPNVLVAPVQAQNERRALGTVAEHLSKLYGGVNFGGFPQFEPPDDDPDKDRYREEVRNQSYRATTANRWLGDISKSLETIAQRNPKLGLDEIMLQNRMTSAQAQEILDGLRDAEYLARSLQGRGVSQVTLEQLQLVMQRLGVVPHPW